MYYVVCNVDVGRLVEGVVVVDIVLGLEVG